MFRRTGLSLAGKLAIAAALCAACVAARAASDQPKPGEPTDPKARKTFAEAIDWQNHGNKGGALDDYRKANKQDGGHCSECLDRAYKLALEIGDYKAAEGVARDEIEQATERYRPGHHGFSPGHGLAARRDEREGREKRAVFQR